MWARERIALGKAGEEAAVAFLKRRGYRILERNRRTPFGEIDAIAREGLSLVVIEIKSRISSSFGPPSFSVTWKKRRKIIQNALFYLKKNHLLGSAWRIDVVAVKMLDHSAVGSIEIIRNAVEEEEI